uniref:Ig-like domain-containing protein n=1 Tax=Poecilia formosa TaxID=48698 RepID=A0A087YJG6_POEFO
VEILQPPFAISRENDPSVTLTCEQDDDQHYYMYWYRRRSSGGLQLVALSHGKDTWDVEPPFNKSRFAMRRPAVLNSTLQIQRPGAADSAVYYCASSKLKLCANFEAYFGQGTKLTVLETENGTKVTEPQTVKILPPSPHECRDQKKKKGERRKTLVCVASGFYPDHVTVFWQLNGQNITDGVATDAAAKRNKTTKLYSITSRLRLQAKTWFNPDNKFSCNVTFFNGTDYNNYSKLIKSKEMDRGMTREKYLTITQNAKLSYSALILKSCLYAALVCFLVWKLQVGPAESAALTSPSILKRLMWD